MRALLLGWALGIEAGLLTLDDARKFVASGLASRCARVLIEPLDADPAAAAAALLDEARGAG